MFLFAFGGVVCLMIFVRFEILRDLYIIYIVVFQLWWFSNVFSWFSSSLECCFFDGPALDAGDLQMG